MTREQKLALIVGFSLILLVGVLISDHLSRARAVQVSEMEADERDIAAATQPNLGATRPNLPDAVPVVSRAPDQVEPQPVTGPSISAEPPPDQRSDAEMAIAMGPATAANLEPGAAPSTSPMNEATRRLIDEFRENGLSGISVPAATTVDPGPAVRQPAVVPPLPEPKAVATTWYTVQPGETLFQIAKRRYGKGSAWKEIAELNKGRVGPDGGVRAGAKIELYDSLPGTTPSAQPKAAPTEKPKDRPASRPSSDRRITKAPAKQGAVTYVVRRGDSLGEISQRILGTVKRKDEILALNSAVVDDEDSIQIGMVLKMPAH